MQIRFFGHAAVLLRAADGTTLLVDPYEPGGFGGRMGYAPIEVRADAVISSHRHLDHAGFAPLPNRPVHLDAQGRRARFGPFEVTRHRADHDEYGGRRRGGQVDILQIFADGLRVVHLSDVGHSPRPEQVAALRNPDLLLVPTGGFYTVGAAQAHEWWRRLAPRCGVPIHYKTARCALGLLAAQPFLSYPAQGAHVSEDSLIEVDSAMIRFRQSVVVLPPEC